MNTAASLMGDMVCSATGFNVGFGDEILASSQARGLAAQGKKAAFGTRRAIIWSDQAREIFRGNPNVAPYGGYGIRRYS